MARRRNPILHDGWVSYDVADLVEKYRDALRAFIDEADRIKERDPRISPSDAHRLNTERPRLEKSKDLLNLAIKVHGPVRHEGQIVRGDWWTDDIECAVDDSIQAAQGLCIQIFSPLTGGARKCQKIG